MAAKSITLPITPPLRQASKQRSVDSGLLSPLSPEEETWRSKQNPTQSCQIHPLKIFNPFPSTYRLEKAQVLGSGLWSTVYLTELRLGVNNSVADITPPSTPQRLSFDCATAKTKLYAVKVPARGDAQHVLAAEARILSYLAADPVSHAYIVHFHGLDEQNGALVMDAVPQTLESFAKSLEELSEHARGERIARIFPSITQRLVEGLAWLHSRGIVHGDIKPSNILIRRRSSLQSPNIIETNVDDITPQEIAPLYCDFSASLHSSSGNTSPGTSFGGPSKVAGGGTWEYLAPELLALGSPNPTPSSDVYALGITLLTFLIGGSPFATVSGNRFMLRNAIKMGEPLRFANDGELKNPRRLLGWEEWLRPALVKKPEVRPTAAEWLIQLQKKMR